MFRNRIFIKYLRGSNPSGRTISRSFRTYQNVFDRSVTVLYETNIILKQRILSVVFLLQNFFNFFEKRLDIYAQWAYNKDKK